METHFSLFNQINSLCYWLLANSDYRASIVLDSEQDIYSISIKRGAAELYTTSINGFSQRNPKFLSYELDAIVSALLDIKLSVAA